MEPEETWVWGNTRGGGGAPLKDASGSIVTNLRQVARGSVEVDHLSPLEKKQRERGGGRDYYDEDDRDYDRRSNGYDTRRGGSDRGGDESGPKPSPKKFMSALRDMNGNAGEREAKIRYTLANYLRDINLIIFMCFLICSNRVCCFWGDAGRNKSIKQCSKNRSKRKNGRRPKNKRLKIG